MINLKARDTICIIAIGLCLCAAAFFSVKGLTIYNDYRRAEKTYASISKEYMADSEMINKESGKAAFPEDAVSETSAVCERSAEEQEISEAIRQELEKASDAILPSTRLYVSLDRLLNTNGETVGWIYCPNTVINYPVVQHSDNEYYLNIAFDGSNTAAGAIFLEYTNECDFSDRNNILHGHHMMNGSMFGSLEKWLEEEYYREHPTFYLNTVYGGNYIVDICAAFTTPAHSEAYRYAFSGSNDVMQWYEWISEQSAIHSDITVNPTDRFLTLSTCSNISKESRTVLIGRLRLAR